MNTRRCGVQRLAPEVGPPAWTLVRLILFALLPSVAACRADLAPADRPAAVSPTDRPQQQVVEAITGQARIDHLRRRATEKLSDLVARDSTHPDVAELRAELRDIERQETQLHWREANGFTVEAEAGSYTEGDVWRRMIEDRDRLGLSDEAVQAIRERLAGQAASGPGHPDIRGSVHAPPEAGGGRD